MRKLVASMEEACVGLEERGGGKEGITKTPDLKRNARSDGACFCRHGAFIFPFPTSSTHYMGRRFLCSDLTRLHTWATVKCIKTHVQNQINSKRRGRQRRQGGFILSQRGDGRREYEFPSSTG